MTRKLEAHNSAAKHAFLFGYKYRFKYAIQYACNDVKTAQIYDMLKWKFSIFIIIYVRAGYIYKNLVRTLYITTFVAANQKMIYLKIFKRI